MKRANATNLFRKSGVAQWRDLRLTSMKKRNRRLFPHGTFACAGSETADHSCHQGPVGPTAKRQSSPAGLGIDCNIPVSSSSHAGCPHTLRGPCGYPISNLFLDRGFALG